MPELPDVESFRRYFDATALHQQIVDVEVRSKQVLEADAERLKDGLMGHTFESTRRHGKWLFVGLDDGCWLVLHFGMTGDLQYFKDLGEEPEHDRMLVTFANGYHLAYVSRRKLGEVDLIDDVETFVDEKDLGPDVLSKSFDLHTFKDKLDGRRGMIKSALMDQNLMSGIGNVYSDEILFQTGIHPRAKVKNLSEEQKETLYHTLKEVLQTAIEYQAVPSRFPDSYLIPQRHEEGKCPGCGGELERVKVSGRTAYFCPKCQEKPGAAD